MSVVEAGSIMSGAYERCEAALISSWRSRSGFYIMGSWLRRLGGYAVYPPWESLASASPRPNFPAEDKSQNFRFDVVDPILLSIGRLDVRIYSEEGGKTWQKQW